MKNTIEKQISIKKKELQELEEKFAKEAEKNNPLLVKDLGEICKRLNHDPKKDVIKVNGFDKADHEVLTGIVAKMRICKFYNGGKLPKKDERWYPWNLRKKPGAGLVFYSSNCNDDRANLSSAARLSFVGSKESDAYAKNFMKIEEQIIQL